MKKKISREFSTQNVKPRNHFFRRFFITYLLVLLVPLAAFPIIFHYSSGRIQEQEVSIRSLLVKESASAMDSALDQISKTLITLEQSTNLNNLLYKKSPPRQGSTDPYDLYIAQQQMTKLLEYGRFNYNYAIYLPQSDLVFSSGSFIYGIERFYNYTVSYDGMDYDTFVSKVLNSDHNMDVIPDVQLISRKNISDSRFYQKTDGILYLVSLPISMVGSNCGVAAIHLNSDLLDKLNAIPASDHGCTFVEDSEHNLIYGFFGEQYTGEAPKIEFPDQSGHFVEKLNGTNCLVTYTTSEFNGWRYVSVSPINELNSGLLLLQRIFYFALLIVFVVGLCFCFYFTRQNSAPLEKILLSLQKQSGSPAVPALNSFSALEKHVQNTLDDNYKLNVLLNEQRQNQTNGFYDRLLNGQFGTEEELTANAKYLEVNISAAAYGILLISFEAAGDGQNEYTTQNLAQIYTEYLNFPELPFRLQIHPLSMNQLVIFLFFPEDNDQKNREVLEECFASFFYDALHEFAIDVHICCGRFCVDPLDISLHYTEADLAMRQIESDPPSYTICFYEDLTLEPTIYYYPAAAEIKLLGLVKSKNQTGIENLLNQLFVENLEKRRLSNQVLEAFFTDLRTGVVRISQELKLPIPNDLFCRHKPLNSEWECSQISCYYRQMAESMIPEPDSDDIPSWIISYLEEHYSDSSLSVTSVAEAFSMSSSYFSTYFKKHLDVTFSKYLENLRIKKACELIKNTNKNIEVISAEVGYSSSLSFRRAFKKVMGLPPSSYR